jgi:hypothetical protein
MDYDSEAMVRILDPLLNIMPPPTKPVECGTWEDWIPIQRYPGTRLPIDYKRFINTYGSGQTGDFLWVYNPFSKGYLNLLERVFSDLGSLRVIKTEFGLEEVPYPLYAEPGDSYRGAIRAMEMYFTGLRRARTQINGQSQSMRQEALFGRNIWGISLPF